MRTNTSLSHSSEASLLKCFADLISCDRSNMAQLLALIAEIDERKLWAKHAFPSMFAFCVQRFHMSESATAKRIWAARTARRFPVILRMVADGELHLSGIALIAKHLTADNHRDVLGRAKHRSTREIERLVAELAPRADLPSRVRALPRSVLRPEQSVLRSSTSQAAISTGAGVIEGSETRVGLGGGSVGEGGAAPESVPGSAQRAPDEGAALESPPRSAPGLPRRPLPQHQQIVPLAPRRYKIEVTVDQQTHDTLRALQDVLGHCIPDADPARVISRALELLLDETLKRKAALTPRPRHAGTRPTQSRDPKPKRVRSIPASLRREVWVRDGGRCSFVAANGRRCRATRRIEFHHVLPFASGGGHDTDNIALRCQAHNQYQADLDFGPGFMEAKRRGNDQHSARNARGRSLL